MIDRDGPAISSSATRRRIALGAEWIAGELEDAGYTVMPH
jgi:hypothetical protein